MGETFGFPTVPSCRIHSWRHIDTTDTVEVFWCERCFVVREQVRVLPAAEQELGHSWWAETVVFLGIALVLLALWAT